MIYEKIMKAIIEKKIYLINIRKILYIFRSILIFLFLYISILHCLRTFTAASLKEIRFLSFKKNLKKITKTHLQLLS